MSVCALLCRGTGCVILFAHAGEGVVLAPALFIAQTYRTAGCKHIGSGAHTCRMYPNLCALCATSTPAVDNSAGVCSGTRWKSGVVFHNIIYMLTQGHTLSHTTASMPSKERVMSSRMGAGSASSPAQSDMDTAPPAAAAVVSPKHAEAAFFPRALAPVSCEER